MIWRIKNKSLSLSVPRLMGILNLTPDSFSDGAQYPDPHKALDQALRMEHEGADILDLGAESTRPGAQPVSVQEQLSRLLPVLLKIRTKIKIPISIDTTRAEVAQVGLAEGAHIINDVSGLFDEGEAMARVIRTCGAGLVLMHRRGNAQTMQSMATYKNVVEEVIESLRSSMNWALAWGIQSEQLVVDPGLGFAKNTEHNLEIIRGLESFKELKRPLLLGPSRKAFIGELTGRAKSMREYGTAAVLAVAILRGVRILRVHHVAPMKDVMKVVEALVPGTAVPGDKDVRSLEVV